jgi:hypothetical protein
MNMTTQPSSQTAAQPFSQAATQPSSRETCKRPSAVLASNAMATLETVKQLLNIPDDDHAADARLITLINAASAYIQAQTGRRFELRTYTQRYQAPGQQELVLEEYPIRHVLWVKDCGADKTIDPDSYDAVKLGDIGVVWMDEGWPPRWHRRGLANDPIFNSMYLRVSYTAGYVMPNDVTQSTPEDWILPYDLQMLAWEMIQSKWADVANGSFGLASFSISDVSWSFDRSTRESWLQTINAYKRF